MICHKHVCICGCGSSPDTSPMPSSNEHQKSVFFLNLRNPLKPCLCVGHVHALRRSKVESSTFFSSLLLPWERVLSRCKSGPIWKYQCTLLLYCCPTLHVAGAGCFEVQIIPAAPTETRPPDPGKSPPNNRVVFKTAPPSLPKNRRLASTALPSVHLSQFSVGTIIRYKIHHFWKKARTTRTKLSNRAPFNTSGGGVTRGIKPRDVRTHTYTRSTFATHTSYQTRRLI